MAAQQRAKAMIGRVISERYRIVELVAMGGMGAIYRGEHLLMHKEVAIKVLHPEIEGFPELVTRFEREAVAGAHISHPNVASANDFGKFDGDSYFLVLEFIQGTTLRKLIEQGPMSPERAAAIAIGIARALGASHQKGIIHRDVKPRNVMVDLGATDADVKVKLIDFGLAKVPIEKLSASARDADSARRSLTAAGVVMGTVAYFAPETALGMRSIGAPADLYALGVIFYEMLTGLHPFTPTDPAALFAAHTKAPVPAMSARNPEVSVHPKLEAVVRRLLEKDPSQRYPSAEATVSGIEGALFAASAFEPLPPAFPDQVPLGSPGWFEEKERTRRASRRRLIAAFVVLLLAAGGVYGFYAWKQRENVAPRPAATQTKIVTSATTARPSSSAPEAPPPKSARDRMREAVESEDVTKIGATFTALKTDEPAAFRDRAVQREVAAAAEFMASRGGNEAEAMFEALSKDLGSDGLDILYDVLAHEGTGSAPPPQSPNLISGPARVRILLTREDVAKRMSAAMRIALDLRNAQCQKRVFLFPKAGADGDDRALSILTAMQPPTCGPLGGGCCEKHPDLERAIADIQTRLRK